MDWCTNYIGNKVFFLIRNIQNGCGTHRGFYPMSTVVYLLGYKPAGA